MNMVGDRLFFSFLAMKNLLLGLSRSVWICSFGYSLNMFDSVSCENSRIGFWTSLYHNPVSSLQVPVGSYTLGFITACAFVQMLSAMCLFPQRWQQAHRHCQQLPFSLSHSWLHLPKAPLPRVPSLIHPLLVCCMSSAQKTADWGDLKCIQSHLPWCGWPSSSPAPPQCPSAKPDVEN